MKYLLFIQLVVALVLTFGHTASPTWDKFAMIMAWLVFGVSCGLVARFYRK